MCCQKNCDNIICKYCKNRKNRHDIECSECQEIVCANCWELKKNEYPACVICNNILKCYPFDCCCNYCIDYDVEYGGYDSPDLEYRACYACLHIICDKCSAWCESCEKPFCVDHDCDKGKLCQNAQCDQYDEWYCTTCSKCCCINP
eukprot:371882_1